MSSTRNIKQRIENVESVEQLIKAMDMVASTKLIKSRSQLEGVRPIYNALKNIVEIIGKHEEAKDHVYYQEREVKNSLYIILTSDKGLSGGYNTNISYKALEHMEGKNEKLLVVGFKGNDFFQKHGKNILKSVIDVSDTQVYYGSESLAKWSTEKFLSGEVDEVFVCYTDFINVLNYEPIVERMLPISPWSGESEESEIKYEPDIVVFIDEMVPLYLHMNLFRAFSEAHTSENAARMVSMDAAGKNAEEVIEDLMRQYNRIRQAAITSEITEIVGSRSVMNKEE
ncbi:MAG TPA: ATP synthase F1 subunit gamma [Clostridiaceae bacterium]|nr:ATP synthase F1 subunit gamma [Clostridiaceae bacterium]